MFSQRGFVVRYTFNDYLIPNTWNKYCTKHDRKAVFWSQIIWVGGIKVFYIAFQDSHIDISSLNSF